MVVRFLGMLRPVLASKISLENNYVLLAGPFGSDQSRLVDDFGAKARNVDDILAKKIVFSMTC